MLVPVDRSSLPAGQYRVFITDVTVAESLVLYGFTQAVVVMCVLQRVRRVKVSRRQGVEGLRTVIAFTQLMRLGDAR